VWLGRHAADRRRVGRLVGPEPRGTNGFPQPLKKLSWYHRRPWPRHGYCCAVHGRRTGARPEQHIKEHAMALIVAARFDTFEEAERAAASLMDRGIAGEELHTFFVNPAGWHDRYPLGGDRAADPNSKGAPATAVAGAALVGIVGAVLGGAITWLFSAPALMIVGGIAVGAYIGSLAGAMYSLGRPRQQGRFE